MKSQSTLFYRLNLWSAGWPQGLQTSAAITIFVMVGLAIIVIAPVVGIIGGTMLTVDLIHYAVTGREFS